MPPAGIHIDDITASSPDVDTPLGSAEFLRYSPDGGLDILGSRVDERKLSDIRFESWSARRSEGPLIEVIDKHDMSQAAQNSGSAIELEGLFLALGMSNR